MLGASGHWLCTEHSYANVAADASENCFVSALHGETFPTDGRTVVPASVQSGARVARQFQTDISQQLQQGRRLCFKWDEGSGGLCHGTLQVHRSSSTGVCAWPRQDPQHSRWRQRLAILSGRRHSRDHGDPGRQRRETPCGGARRKCGRKEDRSVQPETDRECEHQTVRVLDATGQATRTRGARRALQRETATSESIRRRTRRGRSHDTDARAGTPDGAPGTYRARPPQITVCAPTMPQ